MMTSKKTECVESVISTEMQHYDFSRGTKPDARIAKHHGKTMVT
jgi:hypothetical protein